MTKVVDRQVEFMDWLEAHKGNEAIEEYLSPVQNQYNELRLHASAIRNLAILDHIPVKFLPHLAGTLGFELLDMPYATECEQRNLLKWAIWIYKHKGTRAAIAKICEILGFTVTFKEIVSEPFLIGGSRLYSIDDRKSYEYGDNFDDSDVSDWEVLGSGATWDVVNQRYIGEGDDPDSGDHVCVQDQTYNTGNSDWMVEAKFEALSGSGDYYPWVGIVLFWEGEYENLKVRLVRKFGVDKLIVEACYSAFCIPLAEIALPSQIDYKTGVHTLRVWDWDNKHLTICLDDRTIAYQVEYPSFWQNGARKGLIVGQATKAAFDDFRVWQLAFVERGLLYKTKEVTKQLYVRLDGNPSQQTAKLEYLETILPNYVPFGVEVIVETV